MDTLNHRKSEAILRVLRPDGTPAANQPVRIDQVTHQFLFGCGAFDTLAMLNVPDEQARERLKNRVDLWLKLFNYGTLPFYWGRYEPEEGQTAYESMMKTSRWLQEHGIRVKGHPLCWHTVCASWLMNYDDDEILRRQLDRIRREVTAFHGVVDMWDVINEVVIMPDFDKYDNAVTRICRKLGRIGLTRQVFEAARECNPDATLLINDFNTSVSYEILLEGLLEAGVPVSAIGIQSHQHQGYWGLEKLQDVLNRFSRFGLPIHFTENTLISGALMPAHIVDLNDWKVDAWPSTAEGEERQAREITEMYTELFSHPSIEAITTWDFTDGGWLHAPSGIIHEDGTPKPAYFALKKLIHGEWETHVQAVTDQNGQVVLKGFRGGYELTSGSGHAAFTLAENTHQNLVLRTD